MSTPLHLDDTSALRPLLAATAAERIADRFVTAIALGEFVVGQKLPSVQDLAQRLLVSSNTVREALARLSALGYVEVTRGRGGGTTVTAQWTAASESMVHRVMETDWEHLKVTLDLRSLIEQQIARTAAQRITARHESRIRGAIAGYEAAERDRPASGIADLEVHQAIAAATGNPQLAVLSLQLRREVNFGFDVEPYSADLRARAIREHRALADAVLERRPEDAARLAAEHFRLNEDLLQALHDRTEHPTGRTAP